MKSAIDDGHCVVLDTDSGVVGYVIMAPAAFFGRDFIALLIVDADHRRTGVGRVLLRAAVEAATTARVFTSTNESNAAMRCLLESENWRFSGRLDGLDDGDPELIYFVNR
ncbi:MAG: GNAT family N-acetyltransferase [Acidimicrobiia bacterium]|nr:GNAT family N-acetyltransferase [Acidimicrobiia bacterium]